MSPVHSFTACLYLMPPHAASKADLLISAALSRHITLIPVIAKADIMTPDEAAWCKERLRQQLDVAATQLPAGGLSNRPPQPFW